MLTNWIAYFATIVPAKYAAYVSTYIAASVTAIFIALVGVLSVQRNWHPLLISIVAVVLALLPQGYEVYLTATNIQWICCVSVFIVLIIDIRDWNNIFRRSTYFFVAISGLTGVCSVMLAPIFFLRSYFMHSKYHFKMGLILAVCAVFQLIIILLNAHQDRSFPTDIFTLTFPLTLQSIWSPLIGGGVVSDLIILLSNATQNWVWITLVYLISMLLVFFVLLSAIKAVKDRHLPITIFGTWICISMLNVLGSIGDPSALVSGWGGGRYFYLGAVCFVILLGFAASNNSSINSKIAYVILFVIMITGIDQIYAGDWKTWLVSGESWYEVVNKCEGARPCDVEVWPGGADWMFQLTKR